MPVNHEDPQPKATVRGSLPYGLVTVVNLGELL